jgi:protein-disulfide isomerase/uncharacterized membrane protein
MATTDPVTTASKDGAPRTHHTWAACFALTGLGLALSAYLVGRVFASLASTAPSGFDLCSALFSTSCDQALRDERFWFMNVPVAGWGVAYFTALAGLLFLSRFMRRSFETEALLAATLLNLTGIAAGLALLAWAWVAHAPVCPFCLAVHAVNLLLLAALWRTGEEPVTTRLRLLRDAWAWLRGARAESTEPARWNLVGLGSVALLAAVAFQWVYVEAALRRPPSARAPDRAEVVAAYRASPREELLVTAENPHLGPLDAPVRLVVFESLRCPGCRDLSPTLSRLRRKFGERLLVVYKHYPLSSSCNARLTRDMQPGACEMAWAAEAARRQARFWPFHDALLASRTDAPRAIADAARGLNLDPARFAADRESSSTRDAVARDIALGDRLKIPGTPTVFLEGRLVQPPTEDVLTILIRYELGRQVAGSARGDRDILDMGRPRKDRPSQGG